MKEIFTRRSVRTFTPEPVSDEHLEKLLRAAMQAPSATNQQPWQFITVTRRETMERIMENHPYSSALKQAPLVIIVCGDLELQRTGKHDYWIQDCSAATQNILLEAVHLGLGGVWHGVFPVEDRVNDLKAIFDLPDSVIPLGFIALGHPQSVPEPVDRYIEERVHREQW